MLISKNPEHRRQDARDPYQKTKLQIGIYSLKVFFRLFRMGISAVKSESLQPVHGLQGERYKSISFSLKPYFCTNRFPISSLLFPTSRNASISPKIFPRFSPRFPSSFLEKVADFPIGTYMVVSF